MSGENHASQPTDLDQCVQTLKSLSRNLSSKSPKVAADLYISVLSLLCHLKADQATLQQRQQQSQQRANDDDERHDIPSPDEIPAITAVIQNSGLFKALLRCLQSVSTPVANEMESPIHPHAHGGGPTGSIVGGSGGTATATSAVPLGGGHFHHLHHANKKRERSASDVDRIVNKSMKLSQSPNVGGRLTYNAKKQQQQQQQLLLQQQQNQQQEGGNNIQPTFNVQVVAASILYAAFQHLDHWPVPFIKAYAEDCFGPRLWVDDDRCQLFVKNLSLAHKQQKQNSNDKDNNKNSNNRDNCTDNNNDKIKKVTEERSKENSKEHTNASGDNEVSTENNALLLEEACKVAEAYHKFEENDDDEQQQQNLPKSPQLQQRRGSLSSVASSVGGNPEVKSVSNESHHSDSAGDKKSKKSVPKRIVPKKVNGSGGDSDSSSSGEEDEEVVVTTESFGDDAKGGESESSLGINVDSPVKNSNKKLLGGEDDIYPFFPRKKLNLTRVRQRYFGVNLEYAHIAISFSLSDRLDSKAKQNSSLLHSLQSFTSLPFMRKLIAASLDRWLKSPALSNLARKLFTLTVKQMKNTDPPLPADLEAIDSILSMRLKANQLNFHIENITSIASGIPTASVTNHIYLRLLREVMRSMDSVNDASTAEHLKMIGAVHSVLPPMLSSDGIAAALLNMMVNPIPEDPLSAATEKGGNQRSHLMKKLRSLIRLIALQLGSSFDGCRLVESLYGGGNSDGWSIRDEEDKARLMFQCVMLLVPPSPKTDPHGARHQQKINRRSIDLSAEPKNQNPTSLLKRNLQISRKLLLTWCCNDYGNLCFPKQAKVKPESTKKSAQDKRRQWNNTKKSSKVGNEEITGAGEPDYDTILTGGGGGQQQRKMPKWLIMSRCLLFMERADSPHMQRFIFPDESIVDNESEWQDVRYRIEQCCSYGADLDDDMMWIILKSSSLNSPNSGISADITLQLLEGLFECCSKKRNCLLRLTDTKLVWELYNLVEYTAPKPRGLPDFEDSEQFDDAENSENESEGDGNGEINGLTKEKTPKYDLPRLAYPAMWWRVTIMVIVMCGASPDRIAATVWEDHPTVRAIIKMVTSGRYRFPTVDCDDKSREEIKKADKSMRDEEALIAEFLFLPPAPEEKKGKDTLEPSHGGSRMSERQREKRERALKREREKVAAKALEVANRRKKQLKSAQKSIMIWDPKGPSRKPPREAAEILLAVEDSFGLSAVFQRSVNPDFLLRTIGETTRGAIERAYHWLIPIISLLPDTIARLPPSAACFLLLRAYGAEAEDRAQLKELSAPLLRHVSDSLKGKLSEIDAVRAFDLLMTDVASSNPDRRRCGRRVLQDAIGKLEDPEIENTEVKSITSIPSWISNILRVKHANGLVGDAIRHMSTAVTFERGRVLRSILIGLEKIIAFAKMNNVEGDWNFATVLVSLISSRQNVCAEAMDKFPELRSLAIRIVHEEFLGYIQNPSKHKMSETDVATTIRVCRDDSDHEEAILPLSILRSASVLLSIWKEEYGDDSASKEAAAAVNELASMLLRPKDEDDSEVGGFASAKIQGSKKRAVAVESWVMLAKSRSDSIAKRAALTAPTGYLPRLLLCSGLPRAPLLTMIDRLGMMGDNAADRDKVFNQLLAPSVTNEWDIGRIVHRREVARKLLGRLSAYIRMNEILFGMDEASVSTTFLVWLSDECRSHDKRNKKVKSSKNKPKIAPCYQSVADASSILANFSEEHLVQDYYESEESGNEEMEMSLFRASVGADVFQPQSDSNSPQTFIEMCMNTGKPSVLEEWLAYHFTATTSATEETTVKGLKNEELNPSAMAQDDEIDLTVLGSSLLRSYLGLQHQHDGLTRIILNWVPFLSRSSGSAELWILIFSVQPDSCDMKWDSLLSKCLSLWCPSHVLSCRDWILFDSKSIDQSELCFDRMVRFLVLASRQNSVQSESFTPVTVKHTSVKSKITDGDFYYWGNSEDFVKATASVALECMRRVSNKKVGVVTGGSFSLETADHCSRNDLPDWLILLLLLVRCGAKQIKLVCEAILDRYSQCCDHDNSDGNNGGTDDERNVLRAVILRLYACNPFAMNLGIAKVRTVLMEAVETHCQNWLTWRSPLDDQIQDMLDSLAAGAGQKMARPLSDLSKKHPLLILRRVNFMTQYLEEDATCKSEQQRVAGGGNDKRGGGGVVEGQSLSGKLEASVSGRKVSVVIRHWGFSFTEPIWVALLDVISSVPVPVLFRCGLKMGLLEFLNVNVRLMFVQSQLRRSNPSDKESKLREKLSELFAAFQTNNASGWYAWLESKMPELLSFGEMRNILMCSHFISPEQAMMMLDRNKRKKPSANNRMPPTEKAAVNEFSQHRDKKIKKTKGR